MLTPTSKPRIVVLSGAGISAESGIKTFRDCKDGLWENYRIEDVCTPDALERNPDLVNSFYNDRRKEVIGAQPNKAHIALAEAEEFFDIQVVTQNVDDLPIKYFYINLIEVFRCLTKNYFIHTKQLI